MGWLKRQWTRLRAWEKRNRDKKDYRFGEHPPQPGMKDYIPPPGPMS